MTSLFIRGVIFFGKNFSGIFFGNGGMGSGGGGSYFFAKFFSRIHASNCAPYFCKTPPAPPVRGVTVGYGGSTGSIPTYPILHILYPNAYILKLWHVFCFLLVITQKKEKKEMKKEDIKTIIVLLGFVLCLYVSCLLG